VDPGGDGNGGLTATGLVCVSCGAQSSPSAKFCSECGTPLDKVTQAAEYKQARVQADSQLKINAASPSDRW
jgi:predicted amidophosphoribosyltransferase